VGDIVCPNSKKNLKPSSFCSKKTSIKSEAEPGYQTGIDQKVNPK